MSDYRHDRRDSDSREQGRHRGRQDEDLPELYSIFQGEVASIQAYGAFVKIPGYKKNGLVHKSQISATRVEDVAEVLEVGDRVYCKVISLGEDGNGKISLSMKVVNQGNGKDQDANLVITKQEEQRRKKGGSFVQPKIELGAVLNTVCRKCGTKGHLAQDCFKTPGSKSYELLPDEEISLPSVQEAKTPSAHKKKKKKKEKKKKLKKSRHRSMSTDSSSSDSDTPHDKHTHKTPKTKKSKKSRRRSASSDSSSSDSDTTHDKQQHKNLQVHHRTPRECSNQRHKSRHSESSSDRDEPKRHQQKNRQEDKSFKQQVSRSDRDKYGHHDSKDKAEFTRKRLKTQDRKRSSIPSPDSDTSSDEHSSRHSKRGRQAENSSHRDSQRTEHRNISKSSHDSEKHRHDHRR